MRPPAVFVRELAPHEGQRLKRLSKRAKHASTRQRASILLASATLMSAPQIARTWMTGESHVRKVIHEFNEHGFESLRPRFGGGRPCRIQIDDERRVVAAAGARPDTLGVPCRERPANGAVISSDEKGPESLCPRHGRGWAARGRPERQRATFNRRHSIRYVAANTIELVPTPTYASYPDWGAFAHALADHVRHGNTPTNRERRGIEAAKRRERRAARTNAELKLAA